MKESLPGSAHFAFCKPLCQFPLRQTLAIYFRMAPTVRPKTGMDSGHDRVWERRKLAHRKLDSKETIPNQTEGDAELNIKNIHESNFPPAEEYGGAEIYPRDITHNIRGYTL